MEKREGGRSTVGVGDADVLVVVVMDGLWFVGGIGNARAVMVGMRIRARVRMSFMLKNIRAIYGLYRLR